jgi:hypothetical protein
LVEPTTAVPELGSVGTLDGCQGSNVDLDRSGMVERESGLLNLRHSSLTFVASDLRRSFGQMDHTFTAMHMVETSSHHNCFPSRSCSHPFAGASRPAGPNPPTTDPVGSLPIIADPSLAMSTSVVAADLDQLATGASARSIVAIA